MPVCVFHRIFLSFFFHFFLILFLFLFYSTILYWFCQISKWICHRYTCVPHPETSSLLPPHTIPLGHPVHQPQASSIMHRNWTGISFHTWKGILTVTFFHKSVTVFLPRTAKHLLPLVADLVAYKRQLILLLGH